MIHLCSLSDRNYLIKGLTLYESLTRHTKDFVLHYLCLDDESYSIIKNSHPNHGNLIPYRVDELLEKDPQLTALKKQEYRYFCWTLASYFTHHLMSTSIGPVTYMDSDIFFHDDFCKILDEIGDKSIGVFRHRQNPMNEPNVHGYFNVGVVYFKNDEIGIEALRWWSDAVINRKYPHLALSGDQKYLDVFLELGDNLYCDGDIGHGSPWEWQLYDFSDYKKDGSIMWEGRKQKLIFSHFSELVYDLDKDSYIPSVSHHCFTSLQRYNEVEGLKFIYDEYFNRLKETNMKYKDCK